MTYSSTLQAGRTRFSASGQNVTSHASSVAARSDTRLGPVSNAIVLLVIVCLIGLLYLTQVTKTNQYSYQIQELQSQQSTLVDQQSDLELTAARLQSAEADAVTAATAELVSVAPAGSIE